MAKKPFKDTLVGGGLIAAAGLINPTLGKLLGGALNVSEAVKLIGTSDASPDEKAKLQEFVLKQQELEITDRSSAREREAKVAASGGSDVLQKTVGWGITLAFLSMIAVATGIVETDISNTNGWNMAFGAVMAKMTAIVSYYFGSSLGSKQKTQMMEK